MDKKPPKTGLLGLLLLASIILIIILFWQKSQIVNQAAVTSSEKNAAQGETSPVADFTASPSPTDICVAATVVIFDTSGVISDADKNELQTKVVNPYLDYECDLNGSGYIVGLSIGPNNGVNKRIYPYSANAVSDEGRQESFFIQKNGESIDWWLPKCPNKCQFTDTFKVRYPEIVAKSASL